VRDWRLGMLPAVFDAKTKRRIANDDQ
jgi:hypothetical protein